jgi:prepilin-type N-terminal cleavage/methylation domain-containing protein
MRIPQRRGFTLMEALVVLAILGTVCGVLVPAVVKVRESAARIQCSNNLKQVVMAAHNYHDQNGHFPSNPDTIPDRHGTVQDLLQPYLE